MPKVKVLSKRKTVHFLDSFAQEAIEEAKKYFDIVLPGDATHKNWHDAQYLLIRSSRLTADDISRCPNLLAIGKQGVGTDKIDITACAKHGIKVFNTPGVNARAVAELVLTLTTSLAREIRPISLRLAAGETLPKEKCSGLVLYRCTIGIVGMGNIGRTVAKIFQGAFESKVIAYDPYMADNAWRDIEHERTDSLKDLLRHSDVVTLHIPLTAETKDLISHNELALMKPTSIIINTARGGIINERALDKALENRLIWGAGLDCHEEEPPTKKRYEMLWKHPNVLSTPHVGAATAQTQIDTAVAAVHRLRDFIDASNQN